jgi:hypothetical protein
MRPPRCREAIPEHLALPVAFTTGKDLPPTGPRLDEAAGPLGLNTIECRTC